MTEYRGISGTYSDFKLVKTRGVVQVIIEFPIEEANQVIESLGGLPMPGKEEHVSLGLRSKLLEIAEAKPPLLPPATSLHDLESPSAIRQGRGDESGAKATVGRFDPERAGGGRDGFDNERRANLSVVGKRRYAEAGDMERARIRSVTLAKDQQFLAWATNYMATDYEWDGGAQFIRDRIGGSRSLIATDPVVYQKFLDMELLFLSDVGRAPEMRA